MMLKTARRRAGLTQTQLAQRARVNQKTISRAESGVQTATSYHTVVHVCHVLAVDPEHIDEFRTGIRACLRST